MIRLQAAACMLCRRLRLVTAHMMLIPPFLCTRLCHTQDVIVVALGQELGEIKARFGHVLTPHLKRLVNCKVYYEPNPEKASHACLAVVLRETRRKREPAGWWW